jgi:hypothetical protein
MSNNSELYSYGGHLSTRILQKFPRKPLFGTLTGKAGFPSLLPGKMHKRNRNPIDFSREMIAFMTALRYTMLTFLLREVRYEYAF